MPNLGFSDLSLPYTHSQVKHFVVSEEAGVTVRPVLAGNVIAALGRPQKRKEPPGNRAAPSSGRIVPTEAKPSELSGCIVGSGKPSVKNKSGTE
jgi:hypothetical protein